MNKSTLIELRNAIALVEAGITNKAADLLKKIFSDGAKQDYSWHTMSEHPEPGTRVALLYSAIDGVSMYYGLWDGEKWLIRKPYTKDEYEDVRENFTLVAWDYLEQK